MSTTLFPKISGKAADFIANLEYFQHNSPSISETTTLPLIGTVKLHGTHADIVIHADHTIQLQSRNMPNLTLQKDVHGFVESMLPLRPWILKLKERIHARFLQPGGEIDPSFPMIIAGEWIGPGIQKGVAINDLPSKIFVIISIAVNGKWLPDAEYADIYIEEAGIYHISRGGFFHASLPVNDIEATLETLQPLANAMEKECPFAKTFGVSGHGEGIVWKVASPFLALNENPKFWIKMKGPMLSVSRVPKIKNQASEDEKELAKTFAEAAVTEARLEQGWNYLAELGVERNKKGVAPFLRWVNGDVEAEEMREIEEMAIDKMLLKKQIDWMGRNWYFKRLEEIGNEVKL